MSPSGVITRFLDFTAVVFDLGDFDTARTMPSFDEALDPASHPLIPALITLLITPTRPGVTPPALEPVARLPIFQKKKYCITVKLCSIFRILTAIARHSVM